MGILHLVNCSPNDSNGLTQCLERAGQGDAILLLEAGVYAALKNPVFSAKLAESSDAVKIYVLEPDLAVRGITAKEVLDGVLLVDYDGFVGLSVEHNPIVSWN